MRSADVASARPGTAYRESIAVAFTSTGASCAGSGNRRRSSLGRLAGRAAFLRRNPTPIRRPRRAAGSRGRCSTEVENGSRHFVTVQHNDGVRYGGGGHVVGAGARSVLPGG